MSFAPDVNSAALVLHDMGACVAKNGAPGRTQRAERQSVRGGAGRDEKDLNLCLERLAEERGGLGAERIVAIGGRGSIVGREEGLDDRLAHACGIIACKI